MPGNRVSLIADIQLPPDTHVYSPGVKGYRPIQLAVRETSGIELAPVTYPGSEGSLFGGDPGARPGVCGKVPIVQDVTINFSPTSDVVRSLISSGKKVTVSGELTYQACDKTVAIRPNPYR